MRPGDRNGAEASPALISKITDVVADEITTWQNRAVDEVHRILYIDAFSGGGMVTNKSAHLVIGVDVHGIKNVLGIWLQDTEGSKFRPNVFTQRDALSGGRPAARPAVYCAIRAVLSGGFDIAWDENLEAARRLVASSTK